VPLPACLPACTGVYSFEGREWEVVTEAAKDMITLMLVMDITDRATAKQLIQHRWFQVGGHACAGAGRGARRHAQNSIITHPAPVRFAWHALLLLPARGGCRQDWKQGCVAVVREPRGPPEHPQQVVGKCGGLLRLQALPVLSGGMQMSSTLLCCSLHLHLLPSSRPLRLRGADAHACTQVAATAPAAALGAHMVKRLRAFAGMSKMKRLALVVLARTLTDNDVKRLRVSRIAMQPLHALPSP